MFEDDNNGKKENIYTSDNSRLKSEIKDTKDLNKAISNNRLNNILNNKDKGVSKFIQQISEERDIKENSDDRNNEKDLKNKNNNSKYEK